MKKTTRLLVMASLLMGAVAFGSTTASARSHKHEQKHDQRHVQKHLNTHNHKQFNSHSRQNFSGHSRKHAYKHGRKDYRKHQNHYVTDRQRHGGYGGGYRVAYYQPEIHITPHGVAVHIHPNVVYNRGHYANYSSY